MSEHITEIEVSGNRIPPRIVRNVWRRLFPGGVMPPITAIRVTQEEWDKFKGQSDAHHAACGIPDANAEASIREWGEVVDGDAGVCRTTSGYLVLVLVKAPTPLERLLEHELGHIGRGEAGRLED